MDKLTIQRGNLFKLIKRSFILFIAMILALNALTIVQAEKSTDQSESNQFVIEKVPLKLEYDFVESFYDGMARVIKDKQFGFINSEGIEVIPLGKFELLYNFHDGRAMFKQDNKFGYIDTNGNVVIPPIYQGIAGMAWDFSEGLVAVEKNDKYGVLNRDGNIVIPLNYDIIWPSKEGLIRAFNHGKYGYFDNSGKLVVNFQYDDAEDFKDGFAKVISNGKTLYINKTGKEVIRCSSDEFYYSFSDGCAIFEKGGKFGYINDKGDIISPLQYDFAFDFHEGLANVRTNVTRKEEHVIDSYGSTLTIIGSGNNGYIDKTGKVAIPFDYENAGPFKDGLARVKKNDKWGYIDKTGKVIIPFKFDSADDFYDGLACVGQDHKLGFIDKNGTLIVPYKYDSVSINNSVEGLGNFREGLLLAKKDGKYSILQQTKLPLTLLGSGKSDEQPSTWALNDINRAISFGIVPESLKTNFTNPITRQDFCLLAVKLVEEVTGKEIDDRKKFDDTNDLTIEKLGGLGVINGVGNNKFEPLNYITREAAAVILSKLLRVIGKSLKYAKPSFADNDSISQWAKQYVGQVQNAGIMKGIGDNIFAPQDVYTREQSIITILKLLD